MRKNNQRSVTMRDVAILAGVSASTVSRVLSHSPSTVPISEETYKRVQEAVDSLGYHPNMTARSLRTQRTHMIAVMIADITNPFYHSIVRTIQDGARQRNYDVIIANTDHKQEYELRFCEAMMRRPVDGIIMVPYHLTDDDLDHLLQNINAEIVVLGDNIHHPAVDIVHADDELATYEAVRWLIQQKRHRRIAFLHVADTNPGERRKRGYENALREAGIALVPDYIQLGDWSVESGEQAIQNLFALPKPPTALFACNDHMAIGALNQALEMKLHVPRDIAIVGFDNIPATTLVRPKLTSVAQHPVEIGNLLLQSLFERINQVHASPRRVMASKLELIVRDTT